MHENMVDVLIYLYEHYMDAETPPPSDQNELEEELSRVGFTNIEIRKALRWLDELAEGMDRPEHRPHAGGSMRIYSALECARLDLEARGFLLFLEQEGILDPVSRELVIDRVLALDHGGVSLDEIKWVVLLVLMNRPGREAAFFQMEDMVYDDRPDLLH